jgi:hypothetical protein
VTARQEDVRPKRALLLHLTKAATNWTVWDITPASPGGATLLDHPGGMQSDGKRLWIPIAESKPRSRSLVCVFPLADLVAGRPLKPALEFPVNDHIGALAVAAERELVLGANWDTESVYVWDLAGHLKRKLTGPALAVRGLGLGTGSDNRSGIAVQDWKLGRRLFASGLCRSSGAAEDSRSRLISFADFLEAGFQRWTVALPPRNQSELAREAMALAEGFVYFLPEDLGESNRLFRIPLAELEQRRKP